MVLLGYNTPVHNPTAPEHDPQGNFQNQLSMQAGAYQKRIALGECAVSRNFNH
jgi:hypothetical protein